MNLNEYFERLEKEFGLTPFEFCKIKSITYNSLRKYLAGGRPTRHVALKLEHATGKRVTVEEMGVKRKKSA